MSESLYNYLCGRVSTVIFLLVVVAAAAATAQSGASRHHLCSRWSRIQKPMPSRQSYRRPVYRDGRVTYQVAYRTVFRMQTRHKRVQACCPGWEKKDLSDKYCSKPVCKHKCQHELDECTGRHRCQQVCVNTVGSYKCDCHEGFTLAEDGKACTLCLSCAPEFVSMQQQLANLTMKINDLEGEKAALQSNLSKAVSRMDEAQEQQQQARRSIPGTMTAPVSTTEELPVYDLPLDRLTSLSAQISILEERMADCECNKKDYYYP